MIVKIQRPLALINEPVPKAMVYDKHRKFQAVIPFTPEIEALFKDGELKVYHEVKPTRRSLTIGDRVEEQDF